MTTKKIWGNACWFLFHGVAMKLRNDREDLVKPIFDKLLYICRHLPCPICSQHAINTFNKAKRENIRTKDDLINFLFQFHNIVNSQTRSPQFTMEEHNNMYNRISLVCAFNNWRSVMSRNLPGDRSMLYTMSRNNMIKDVSAFFINNRDAFY